MQLTDKPFGAQTTSEPYRLVYILGEVCANTQTRTHRPD
jgi:hypothetical protein